MEERHQLLERLERDALEERHRRELALDKGVEDLARDLDRAVGVHVELARGEAHLHMPCTCHTHEGCTCVCTCTGCTCERAAKRTSSASSSAVTVEARGRPSSASIPKSTKALPGRSRGQECTTSGAQSVRSTTEPPTRM